MVPGCIKEGRHPSCNPDLGVGDFLETDAGFGWVEVAGVRVYSCYFSPNDPLEIFETQILLLEESLREDSGRSLIAGDFDSKSPEWGEARLDRRGILVGEMAARNDLIVLNQGRDFTFRRGAGGSIIDLTYVAPRLASRIVDWCVLQVITLSDHRSSKRRLMASVVNSKLLYAAPIWTSALNNHAILKKLFSAQKGVVMSIVWAYRNVSTSAVLVLTSVPPFDLLAEERKETL